MQDASDRATEAPTLLSVKLYGCTYTKNSRRHSMQHVVREINALQQRHSAESPRRDRLNVVSFKVYSFNSVFNIKL